MNFITLTRHAIKRSRRLWLSYDVIGLAFLWLYMQTFPIVQSQSTNYAQIIKALPKGLASAFNITDVAPTLMSFLSSKHFGLIWPLMIIIFVMSQAASAIAREIEQRTIGFLLSQAISRSTIYWSRWTAAVIGLLQFVLVTELTTWLFARAYNYAVSFGDVWHLGLLGFLFGLAILGLSFMVSAVVSSGSKVNAIVGGGMLVMYVLFIAASLENNLSKLGYLSLFKYYSPGDVVTSGAISLQSVWVYTLVATITTYLGYGWFSRRDIDV
ncbi:ABC transporter permease subunit [Candidatus Saccharibacteria bacterium]|nr:ABC transporter permease subunit [Candidatus Saccharibacteria bacterium]